MTLRIAALIFTFWILIVGCKKQEPTIQKERSYSSGFPGRVNDLIVVNDTTWLAVGGIRGQEGWASWSTTSPGNLKAVKMNDKGSMNCAVQLPSGAFWIGGERIRICQLDNLSSNAVPSVIWPGDNQPVNEEDRTTVREILAKNDSMIFFVTGDNLGSGLFYTHNLLRNSWEFSQWDNELRSLVFYGASNTFAAGHGKALLCTEGGVCEPIVCDGIYISSLIHVREQILGCASDGRIYKWDADEKKFIPRKSEDRSLRKFVLTDIAARGDTALAVGNEGALVWTYDGGNTWNQSRVEGDPDMYCVSLHGNHLYAGCDGGEIVQIKLP